MLHKPLLHCNNYNTGYSSKINPFMTPVLIRSNSVTIPHSWQGKVCWYYNSLHAWIFCLLSNLFHETHLATNYDNKLTSINQPFTLNDLTCPPFLHMCASKLRYCKYFTRANKLVAHNWQHVVTIICGNNFMEMMSHFWYFNLDACLS